MSNRTSNILLILSLLLAVLAGIGAGYLLRGEQDKTPIIIEKAN